MVVMTQVRREWPVRRVWHRLVGRSPIDRLSKVDKKSGKDGYDYLFLKQDQNYAATPYTANLLDVFQ